MLHAAVPPFALDKGDVTVLYSHVESSKGTNLRKLGAEMPSMHVNVLPRAPGRKSYLCAVRFADSGSKVDLAA